MVCFCLETVESPHAMFLLLDMIYRIDLIILFNYVLVHIYICIPLELSGPDNAIAHFFICFL